MPPINANVRLYDSVESAFIGGVFFQVYFVAPL